MAMQPALLGGLFIGVLSALPIISFCNCCCLWVLAGGFLASYLQQQNQPATLSVGRGAQVGLLAGAVGAFVWLVTDSVLAVLLAPVREMISGELLRNARDLPPEVRAMIESAGQDGAAGRVLVFFIMLIFGSLIAAAGGAIGAAYFRKDVPPALGGPIQPPPLP